MTAFAANLVAIIAFATGLVALTVFATTKVIDLVPNPSKTGKYLLSFLATAISVAAVGFLGGDKVFSLVTLLFQDTNIGTAPAQPEGITVFQWFLVGFLDWLVAGGIWDWRQTKK